MPDTLNRVIRERRQEVQEITVWLGKKNTETTFWCPFCRAGIIKHTQRIIAIINGSPDSQSFLSPPISVQCKGCGATFHYCGFNA